MKFFSEPFSQEATIAFDPKKEELTYESVQDKQNQNMHSYISDIYIAINGDTYKCPTMTSGIDTRLNIYSVIKEHPKHSEKYLT